MSDFSFKYRKFRLGDLGTQFEGLIWKAKKGELPDENIVYFMTHAKRYYSNSPQSIERTKRIDKLLERWRYWLDTKTTLTEKRKFSDVTLQLIKLNNYLNNSYSYVKFDSVLDLKLHRISLSNSNLYYEWIIHKINVRLRELFYEIMGEIWLSIYANTMISDTEIITVLQAIEAKTEIPNNQIEIETDETIDENKTGIEEKPIEPTNICFRRVFRIMQPFLEEFKKGFFSGETFDNKIFNCELYVFMLLLTVNKIFPKNDELNTILNGVLIKRIEEYKYVKYLNKVASSKEVVELFLEIQNELRTLTLVMFEKSEELTNKLKNVEDSSSRERGKLYNIRYTLTSSIDEYTRKHLVGLQITYDQINAIMESVKQGERVRDLTLNITPITLTPQDLGKKAIILGIGKTGGGKTVEGLDLCRSFINSGYVVVDSSLNVKRSQELIWSILPLDKKHWKDEFERLTEVQKGCFPEKTDSHILFPFMNTELMPKYVPNCTKFFTIPLKSLAKKPFARNLLFTRPPDKITSDFIDRILENVAEDEWDLQSLRYELKRIIEGYKEQNYITVKEVYGEKVFKRRWEFDLNTAKKALSSLLVTSNLISNSKASTNINFVELVSNPNLVQLYYGHIDEETAYYINKWWIYSWMEFKQRHMTVKLAFFMNEAQTVIPSQPLIGGTMSSEKYSSAVDTADLVLQVRGLGIYIIALTQMPRQLKKQIPSQQGLMIIFHDTDPDDLDFAFNDLPDEGMQTTLKMLVKNRFFADEHMVVFKFGIESDQVRIMLAAMPPCAVERQNVDVFDFLHEYHNIDTKESRPEIDRIMKEKESALEKLFERDIQSGLIEVLETGKTIVPISSSQVVIEKSELENVTQIPEGHTVVSNEQIERMKELERVKKGSTFVDNETLRALIETKPVKPNQIVVDKSIWEKLIADYSLPKEPDILTVKQKKIRKEEEVIEVLKMIIFGCKPFKFWVYTITKSKPVGICLREDVFEKLNIRMSWVCFWEGCQNIKIDPLLTKILARGMVNRKTIYEVISLSKDLIEQQLGEDYLNKIIDYCAIHLYPSLKDILPWKQEVIDSYNYYSNKILKDRSATIDKGSQTLVTPTTNTNGIVEN